MCGHISQSLGAHFDDRDVEAINLANIHDTRPAYVLSGRPKTCYGPFALENFNAE